MKTYCNRLKITTRLKRFFPFISPDLFRYEKIGNSTAFIRISRASSVVGVPPVRHSRLARLNFYFSDVIKISLNTLVQFSNQIMLIEHRFTHSSTEIASINT